MRREERFMNILGGLDEKYVAMAMPSYAGRNEADDTRHIVLDTSAETVEISKKDVRRYMIMRAIGMAAVVVLIVGAAVLLVQNWDKIAVREPERPGAVTSMTEISESTASVDAAESTADNTNDTISDIIEDYTDASEWGITADIIKADKYGISYRVSRSGRNRYEGDIKYSDAYSVENNIDGKWENVITQHDDNLGNTLPYYGQNEHKRIYGITLEPGKYRLMLLFDGSADKSERYPETAKMYLEFEIYPSRQTFDVKYYYKNDLAGIAAGYSPAFQRPFDMYADGTGWEWIGNAECKDLFASDHDKFPNEVPAELIDILKNYADGDDLKPDLGGDLEPITKRYMILSDNEAYPSGDSITSYRIGYMPGSDFLITVDTDTGGLSVFRENTEYTAARRVMELLWANYDDSFEVFAVLDSDNGERVEYLLICASDNLFVIGEEERYNALERVKSLLSENGLLDDDLIKFTTPGQLRETWIPVEIIDDTGRLNGSMIRVADRVFRLADDMDIEEYEKFLKDNGMIAPDAPRKAVFGLGEAVTPYKDLLDILDIGVGDSRDLRNYGQITDEIIGSTGIVADTVEVWVYDKALSEAVWKTVHVRMLQELCPQINKIDLVVGSEPDEYKIVIHANTSDQELLKNNEAFKMFYDTELMGFAE